MALLEKPGQSLDADELEWQGAMLHNVASCLHHLAELDAAQAYYELAIANFRRAEQLLFGIAALRPGPEHDSVNRRRIDFVNQRISDIGRQQAPDTRSYMDSSGTRRPVLRETGPAADELVAAATVARPVSSSGPGFWPRPFIYRAAPRLNIYCLQAEVTATVGKGHSTLLLTVPNALRPCRSTVRRANASSGSGSELEAGAAGVG